MRRAVTCWSASVWVTARESGPANQWVSHWGRSDPSALNHGKHLLPFRLNVIQHGRFLLFNGLCPSACSRALLRQLGGNLLRGGRDLGEAVPGLDGGGLHLPGRGQRPHHLHL